MALTKEAIAEIQAAAKVNFHRVVREQEAREADKKAVEEAVKAAKTTKTEVKPVASKKGK